ncbi:MAG TPA: tetratricopeptide repeat protein [Pirellulales bacterium]|nr:tetratricopeptide repeat protein [Pirellulales bacterium]
MKIAESGRPLQDVLRQNLTQAVHELEGSAIGDPLEVATMQDTLGNSLVGLGDATLAVEVFQKALNTRKARLGPDHRDTLASMNHLARAYQISGQLAKAMPLFEETLEKRKAALGPDHPDTLESMNNQAGAYLAGDQRAMSTPLFEETLEKRKATLGPDHPDTLATMGHLAAAYALNGQLAKAVPIYEETLQKRKAALGPDHPDTLESMDDLATGYMASGRLAKAVPLYEETLQKRKAQLGPDHPNTLGGMNNLALAYMASGQLAKAVTLFEETLQKQEAKLGSDHPQTIPVKENLASARLLDCTERYARERATKGPKHIDTLLALRGVAQMHLALRQPDVAEPLLVEVLDGLALGPDDPIRAFTVGLLQQTFDLRAEMAPDSWNTFNTQSLLGGALLGQRKYAEAELLLVTGHEGMKAREATIPQTDGGELRIPEAIDRLIELYTATNEPEEAKRWRSERAKYPETRPTSEK